MPVERWNDEKLDSLATSVAEQGTLIADLKIAAALLVETATLHQRGLETSQRNFETIVARIDQMQSEVREMQSEVREMQSEVREMQSEVRGLQTENRRIFDILSQQQGE